MYSKIFLYRGNVLFMNFLSVFVCTIGTSLLVFANVYVLASAFFQSEKEKETKFKHLHYPKRFCFFLANIH
ncbi:XXYS1_4_G0005870.mRNA.1.CDS.1 [Saccharomyces cerevisiae]|nr:EM14S01-3B_G0002990.mRNA.1.CDS.1 [Saccharomyces cerevisiae]CAD6634518.1 XXYS1_4_G0005870.mRNA.1.CDS.1 [Saccharomyces cerevisiae]CAI4586032.1 AMH_1a_G0031520.mRNA.1.CDS.1 [Saccharomyces cerevisiae]CAI4586526.1 CEI_1a_G0031370.mRNA.1.CDS.1 [Saccharomyces cerevisiae]CAI6758053.1 AMH_1a_G0031520.mRNA.1.CDS.1 [Saccharomyces cerevisiae]